jgi:hypothetical protein
MAVKAKMLALALVPLLAALSAGAAVESSAKRDLSEICGKAPHRRIVGMLKFTYKVESTRKPLCKHPHAQKSEILIYNFFNPGIVFTFWFLSAYDIIAYLLTG